MKKNYRQTQEKYCSVSLRLSKDTYDKLETAVGYTDHNNMSQTIEEIVSMYPIEKMPRKRPHNNTPSVRKTLTFTDKFVRKISDSENVSFFIESSLSKALQ